MEILVAGAVVVALGAAIVGLVRWARGGAPYDDGTGGMYVPYVPEGDADRGGRDVRGDDGDRMDGPGPGSGDGGDGDGGGGDGGGGDGGGGD